MSKYIHVDGDDGGMFVSPDQKNLTIGKEEGWFNNGWIYKVPDDFKVVVTLKTIPNHIYLYELLSDHKDAELVFQGE
ncbi:hypothetical protein LCGC14_1101590 [marine sediment metagenome]|uniref:Uncharacterized protein n=1 Tax=marine sediment metagenome TaxID=412755 RepID=A0A0F9MX52_9ZZZZ